jgi:translation initiation factor 2 beta subunit (eIF-2beta)/eIF-5
VATEICQYCGVDLETTPPGQEIGYLYVIECSRCPADRRHTRLLPRRERVEALTCPDCGGRIAPAGEHPDVIVVKELTFEVCSACGERNGVVSARKLRDLSGGMM